MKKNIIKGILLGILLIPNVVKAAPSASATCSASSTVTLNNTVVVTVRGSSSEAMWDTTLNYDSSKLQYISGSALHSISDDFVTSITYTYTFKAVAEGGAYVKTSSAISDYDGQKAFPTSSCSINIVKAAPAVPKSSDNNLSSLSIEDVEISPEFSKSEYEYNAEVENEIDKVNILAKASHSRATISGIGEKELVEGENEFEIVVRAENGASKTYTIVVNRKEKNPIEVKIDGKKYNLLRSLKNIEIPELFDESIIKIDGEEVPALVNKKLKYTLVVLRDDKGEINFYSYKDGKYTIFNQILSQGINFVMLGMERVPINYKKVIVNIDGKKVECYKVSGDSRVLLYGTNLNTGKENYYTYDRDEKTLQIFDIDKYEENVKNNLNNKYLIYGLTLGIVLLFILLILFISKSNKQKKLINIAKETVLEKEDIENAEIKKEKKIKKKEVVEETKEELIDFEDEYDPDPYNILSDKKKKSKKKK